MIYKSFLIENNINEIKENLILFYGENLGLKNDFKKKIKNSKDKNVIVFNQDNIIANSGLLYNEISNISLFEKNKVFIIELVTDKILASIEEIIPKINNETIYLFADVLDKKSKLRSFFEKSNLCGVVPCYEDNEIGIKNIINKKLRGYSGLTPNNINLILDHVGLDRAKLNNEIDKIQTFFDKKEIVSSKLETLLDSKITEDFNKLKDEALLGDKIKTNKLLSETIIDNDKLIYYLNLINQRLIKINEINISPGGSLENKINSLRPPIFWKDKPNFVKQIKKWTPKKLKNLQIKLLDLEIKFKSNSNINKDVLLKNLMVEICVYANT